MKSINWQFSAFIIKESKNALANERLLHLPAKIMLSLSLMLSANNAFGQDSVLDPETEISAIKTELSNLQSQLTAAKEMFSRLGLGPQTAEAEQAYKNALQFFRHGEFPSAVREISKHLNLTQVPEVGRYLECQYLLGQAYEEMGDQGHALRAYFRYVAAFLTAESRNQNEMLNVMRRMLPLALSDEASSKELNKLLASMTSLTLPEDIRPPVMFYAAKAAAANGEMTLAVNWLDTVIQTSKTSTLKAKALYVKSVIALAKRDFNAAEELLGEVTVVDKEGTIKDLARLALARAAIARRNPKSAIKYYKLINENSAEHREALFESIYVLADLNEYAEARTKAMLYIARYPERPEAFQLRLLLAYLDLKAGDLSTASASIQAADKHLGEIGGWMQKNLLGKKSISAIELQDLISLTTGHVSTIPSVHTAQQIFSKLALMRRRLADNRGDVNNLIFTMGRMHIEQLKPQWANRSEQLARLSEQLLKIGHRLIATERHLYKPRFDAIAWQQLTASESRRTRLTTPPAAARRHMNFWGSYAHYLEHLQDLAGLQTKLQRTEAELAAMRYQLTQSQNIKERAARTQKISAAYAKARRLQASVKRATEILRLDRLESILAESPHRATRAFMTHYALELDQEEQIVAKARETADTASQRLLADDALSAWRHWRHLMSEAYEQIQDLDNEVAKRLKDVSAELESHEERHNELLQRLDALTANLEKQLGQSLSYILDQYYGAIQGRKSRHQKWKADIEWLAFQGSLKEEQKLKAKFDLEKQILRDNLTDLQQGVLWQWPQ